MALIGQIRNNMWLVFIIIALATLSFILMDAMGPGGGGPSVSNSIGKIAGQDVSNREFESAYSSLFANAQDPNASRAALWNYFVEQKIVNSESDKLGLSVGYDELMDLQFGSNLSPIIYQNFRDPQTGQLMTGQLQQIRSQLEGGEALSPQFAQFWGEQEKQIVKAQLQNKMTGLAQKAIYTPNWLAEAMYSEENATASAAVVKIPFDVITADVEVSDSDINSYISNRKSDFERTEEKRVLSYVKMDVLPTPGDTLNCRNEMNGVIGRFATTDSDSLFAQANNGIYTNYYAKAEELDEFYADKVGSFEVGKVYGPYVLGRSFQAVKLLDKQVLPDSVRASHILKRVTPGNAAQSDEAESIIDSLMTVVKLGRTPFDTLAVKFSEDLGSGRDGGDLGYFAQGAMVGPFNQVAFIDGKEGNYYKVKTQIGWHLIYIGDQKFNTRESKYKMAYVNVPIVPSKETQDALYNNMVDLVSEHPYLDDLTTAVASIGNLEVQTSNELGANDYLITGMAPGNESRQIAKWAFTSGTSVNDVSPQVYQFQDPVLYYNNAYVVAGLSAIKKPGMPSAAEVRNQVEVAVRNQLKGKSILGSLSDNLGSVASQYGAKVDTLRNINMLNTFVPAIGNEPEVVGAAFASGGVQKILGNSGVFVVQPLGKQQAGDVTNVAFIKNTVAQGVKGRAATELLQALKDKVEITDNRSTFY
jgi:peptidyl-prolyl cis-trans isomerase D